ncbi:MAG: AAA family ATPase, partial [Firmicutes bacterium]|nr:AAA family ATPase [Bacillota bacterium]
MSKSDYLKALIRTHAEGDDERFYAVALQVAAQEARQGHTKFAQELRDLVDQARARGKTLPAGQHTRPVAIIQPRGELAAVRSPAS